MIRLLTPAGHLYIEGTDIRSIEDIKPQPDGSVARVDMKYGRCHFVSDKAETIYGLLYAEKQTSIVKAN